MTDILGVGWDSHHLENGLLQKGQSLHLHVEGSKACRLLINTKYKTKDM
jgi:hypothetical protein